MCCDLKLNLLDYCENFGIVCGRTMEFRDPLNSKIVIFPRNRAFKSISVLNKLEWVNLYGFVGIQVLDTNIIVDGMNEMGLSCGVLSLDDTKYNIPSSSMSSISILDICTWILGTCSTVYEAIASLNTVKIWGEIAPILNRIIGLHIVIHDTDGNSIVCELTSTNNEVINIYHTNGVTTNGPIYPEQLHLLNEYRTSKLIIPDNSSSITRFIKLSQLKELCLPDSFNTFGLVQLISHIFNTVDIIKGMSVNKNADHPYQITQWCLIKDLTSKIIYFRSYNNMTIRRLNLNTIEFSGIKEYSNISLDDTNPTILDINI